MIRLCGRLNWLSSLHCQTESGINCETVTHTTSPPGEWLLLTDENGEIYSGLYAVEQACTRCPPLWPVALLFKVPGAFQCVRPIFDRHSGLVPPPADVVERSLHEVEPAYEIKAAA
jgi:hypothetical protein